MQKTSTLSKILYNFVLEESGPFPVFKRNNCSFQILFELEIGSQIFIYIYIHAIRKGFTSENRVDRSLHKSTGINFLQLDLSWLNARISSSKWAPILQNLCLFFGVHPQPRLYSLNPVDFHGCVAFVFNATKLNRSMIARCNKIRLFRRFAHKRPQFVTVPFSRLVETWSFAMQDSNNGNPDLEANTVYLDSIKVPLFLLGCWVFSKEATSLARCAIS